MDTFSSLVIITLAALIHASFQLSVSMLTLLSSHTVGAKAKHSKLVHLTGSFGAGVTVMTLLLVSSTAFIFERLFPIATPQIIWAIVCGAMVGLAFSVWSMYYRRGDGTSLWLPRGLARYLTARTKATKIGGEAFGLGIMSVMAELVFIATPIIVAALTLIRLPFSYQLAGLALYIGVSMASLVIVWILIGSGHRISVVQRWRESNKRFLQFAGGSGLLVLGFYIYVDQILASETVALSGVLH